MHADPASAETLPQLSAPLGSTATHTLTLDNPVGVEVVLQISCSNPQTFILNSMSVVLPPYGQTELPVIYMPSTLGEASLCHYEGLNHGLAFALHFYTRLSTLLLAVQCCFEPHVDASH